MSRECSFEGLTDLFKIDGSSNDLLIIEGGILTGEIRGRSFVQSTFEKELSFKDILFQEKLEFDNCVFEEQISFTNISIKSRLIFNNCSMKCGISFSSCSFNEIQIINGDYKEITFKGANKEFQNGENKITISTKSCDNLTFTATEINCALDFVNSKIETISFNKSQFKGSITFGNNNDIKSLFIQSCTFNDRIDFLNSSFKEIIYIHKCNLEEQFVISKDLKVRSLTFANVLAKQTVTLSHSGNIEFLEISDSRFDSNFHCYSPGDNQFKGDLNCNMSGILNGNIIFENVAIPYLSVGGINFGNIILNRIKTRLILLQDFRNRNRLTLSNLRLNEEYNLLLVFDSDINQTEFVNIDFTKFQEVVVAKSEVSNMILSNSKFPRSIQIKTKDPKLGFEIDTQEKIHDHLYFRESYRQLKIAMEKQGNRNEALHYKSIEMQYLRKELKFGWDKCLLYLNYISNGHGTSWGRGIFFTVTSSLFFFLLYIYFSSHGVFNTLNSDDYFEYISSFPGLRLSRISDNRWQTDFIVVVSRIFIGYGVYQTITAFRKYGGK